MPRRKRMPMFQAGTRVLVRYGPQDEEEGRVAMASVSMRSLFIDLEGGTRLVVLGLPRPRGGAGSSGRAGAGRSDTANG